MADVRWRLDGDAAALVSAIVQTDPPTLEARGVAGARLYLEENAARAAPGPTVHHVEDRVIGELPVRVYRPAAGGPLPVVTYFHGGGWVIGSLATSDAFCRRLATTTPCTVVSVDYRLAPEHPWPAAVDDGIAAIEWTAARLDELGGGGRLVVLGDSAGGNVATVAARRFAERAPGRVARQVLAYPTLSTEQHWASHAAHGSTWPLTSSDLAWFVRSYVPDEADRRNPDVSPLHADVSSLPPATILLAGCDPLHDEGMAYARHLAAAGVPVDVHDFTGQIHGFLTMAEDVLPRSREALGLVANAIRCA